MADATTIVAICALVVAVFSTGLAVWTGFVHRRHMQLSVQPIAAVPVADFEDCVGVYLRNKGLGPMRILFLRVTNDAGKSHDDIVSHMPTLQPGVIWSTFYDSVDGSTLEAGSQFDLLVLEGRPDDPAYQASRDSVRGALAKLVVIVEYEDLYRRRMEPHEKALSWFGRHDA